MKDVTPELFTQQCKRRFGTSNPERMRVSLWEWMVRCGEDPYAVRKALGIDRDLSDGPDWCFDRFGISQTFMSDGRVICVGGEHEDYYDPDFCIYNDVIVLRPAGGREKVSVDSGELEIYGYPEADFSPTDFHSATVVGDAILLIGRLGYPETRQVDATPVFSLDTASYRITRVRARGSCPGWINRHHAAYDAASHSILVRGGKVFVEGTKTQTTNSAVHRLHLNDLRWEIVTEKEPHRRYEIRAMGRLDRSYDEDLPPENFRPKCVAHTWLPPTGSEVIVYRLDVQGVRVEFTNFYAEVKVLVEGDLAPEITRQLLREIAGNLSESTGVEWQPGEWVPVSE